MGVAEQGRIERENWGIGGFGDRHGKQREESAEGSTGELLSLSSLFCSFILDVKIQ